MGTDLHSNTVGHRDSFWNDGNTLKLDCDELFRLNIKLCILNLNNAIKDLILPCAHTYVALDFTKFIIPSSGMTT